ncbi:MAG: T9SS type A sorting domain-containing protein [Bacteroidales bacterium]|nr:T9SS type A sorting domain-containing protein [Bacteroidales bacterium]MCF8344507.1 T9SS type A sorting domain-containing protein [Bacteroidales bacterium]MCF8352017.1 T9SS type A sorting domain-containing protein [Bacteroidales bacterium]MCF8377619.1 T9SS type A sorting domain-containing protein [Bacteroidales bacterium]MCF8402037.1 T9SS type A sorting domain-containing protein [Bacteroidales bacterium]
MKKKITLLAVLVMIIVGFAGAQPAVLEAEYGPPEEADTWTKFTIPLNADTFNVSEAEFEAALMNITSFWIRTEMHTGDDIGGIDDVAAGSVYFSDFNASSEGWSSGGDGTMEWMMEGGVDGGFLQISDWATGDWHWLISPSTWAGDWSELNGQNIEFWYKTDKPSYSAVIQLHTETVDRLVINTQGGSAMQPNDSLLIEVEVIPEPEEDLIIDFTSSNQACINVPSSLTIEAGSSSNTIYVSATEGASIGCTSVVEATASGYITSRLTFAVTEDADINEIGAPETLLIAPNPSNGFFRIMEKTGEKIESLRIYGVQGGLVYEMFAEDLTGSEINVSELEPGLYFIRAESANNSFVSKLIID